MKALVKSVVASRLGWRVASSALREPGVSVLMYHSVSKPGDPFRGMPLERFRAQMHWLKDNCRVIEPDELESAATHARTERPPVLITFDDGYRDYHDLAYPILAELQMPAVVFLATAFIDGGGMIWTDAVTWAITHSPRSEVELPWNGSRHALGDADARRKLEGVCKQFLKGVPDEQRQDWQQRLTTALDMDRAVPDSQRRMLNWDEVRATSRWTRWGGHTHNHPILSQLSEARMEEEIRLCRDRIRDETGSAPRWFAYPNGRAQDFNAQTQALLRRYGFEQGYATTRGLHHAGTDLHAIRRLPTGGDKVGDFAWLVSGH